MSNRQVAVGSLHAKRQSKSWVRVSTGVLSVNEHVKKLLSDKTLTTNKYQCGKQTYKCYNHFRVIIWDRNMDKYFL